MTDDLNLIASYLARRDLASLVLKSGQEPADALVLLGSSLPGTTRVAAEAISNGIARQIVISGGLGHSTQGLCEQVKKHPVFRIVKTDGRAEADIFADILTQVFAIDPTFIVIENRSTNCGSNATECKALVDCLEGQFERMILVQDPTMQRRTHACFERVWKRSESSVFESFAPFVPTVKRSDSGELEVIGDEDGVWPFERFVSLVLGEIVRLRDDEHGYGPNGKNFIDHVEVPQEILNAYDRVASHYSDDRQFVGN